MPAIPKNTKPGKAPHTFTPPNLKPLPFFLKFADDWHKTRQMKIYNKPTTDYSIVIPVYKSTRSLETIARQVQELQQKVKRTFELIFVNDSLGFVDTDTKI